MEIIRKRLIPIIKTIIFCGHNNLSLRGHRDDGILDIDSAIVRNQVIFQSLLAFRIYSRVTELTNHIKSCQKKIVTRLVKQFKIKLLTFCIKSLLTILYLI